MYELKLSLVCKRAMNDMNDLQIDYFMAVATHSSFTKTSEELFVSQPAISKQIALMEKELGVKLFIRNNKRTELTEAGRRYYDFLADTRQRWETSSTRSQSSRELRVRL